MGRERPTAEHFEQMPYLKAVLRESLRLYPVITMNVRQLGEDTVVNGYTIPKNVSSQNNIFFLFLVASFCKRKKCRERDRSRICIVVLPLFGLNFLKYPDTVSCTSKSYFVDKSNISAMDVAEKNSFLHQ